MYRMFTESNSTKPVNHNLYALEMYLHEVLSQSEHRCGERGQAPSSWLHISGLRQGLGFAVCH